MDWVEKLENVKKLAAILALKLIYAHNDDEPKYSHAQMTKF